VRGKGGVLIVGHVATLLVGAGGAASAATESHVKAALVAESAWAVPGAALAVGIRLQMDPGWHTYWKNPGDSGLPTRVAWILPAGLVAGPLLWPTPERFGTQEVVNYGYTGEVLLLSELALPADLDPGKTLRIGATVNWLECRDVCRPGKGEVALEIPVRRGAAASGVSQPLFTTARKRLPAAPAGWTIKASAEAHRLLLAFSPPRPALVERAYFYPGERSLLDHAAPQGLASKAGAHTLLLARDPNRAAPVERLTGVLVTEGRRGSFALEIDVPLRRTGA
jgi:thiol:disulfide interchange protein DsbD